MMNIKEFMEYVAKNVKDYLPPSFENAEIELKDAYKNNDTVLHGIIIKKEEETVTPQIYLDKLYNQYLADGDLDACVGKVADFRIEAGRPEITKPDIGFLKDYELVKEKLMMKICDRETNVENLDGRVVTLHGDFAATYNIIVDKTDDGIATMAIRPEMLEEWDVTVNQLHADALIADKSRKPTMCDLGDVIFSLENSSFKMDNFLDGKEHHELSPEAILCLTNADKMQGASYILHDDIMAKIGEVFGGDYFVLPSSVHECLMVPDNGMHEIDALNEMVKDVNDTIVDPEEILSYKVQHYDSKAHVLENAKKFEQRRKHEKEHSKGIKGKLAEAKKEVTNKVTKSKHKEAQMEM